MKIVTGLFTQEHIMEAIHRLRENGFPQNNLSMISSAAQTPEYLEGNPEEVLTEGAVIGAVTGTGLGAIGTWIASTIPGFDVVLATGLMTTAVGAVIGGYLGSLYSVRAETQAKLDIHEELDNGKILLVVQINKEAADTKQQMAASLMKECGGEHVESHLIPDEETDE